MDFDMLDATQAILEQEFDDETDEDTPLSRKEPVGFLRVAEQKGLQYKEYPVFEGDNIIGRHDSCQICIPSKSLSKEHACITVKSGSHLIYDKGSRNKTKREKLFLYPDVRYELKSGNTLAFADITCTYVFVNQEAEAETGSETEAEEENEGKIDNNNAFSKANVQILCSDSCEDEEDGDASDASEDILMPTQPCEASKAVTIGLRQASSKEETSTPKEISSVIETPDFLKKGFDLTGTLVLPESDTDSEDYRMEKIPQQTLMFDDDDEEEEEDRSKLDSASALLCAATQAFGEKANSGPAVVETQVYNVDDDEDDDEDERWSGSDYFNAATQAMIAKSHKNEQHNIRKSSPQESDMAVAEYEATQAYGLEDDSENSVQSVPVKETAIFPNLSPDKRKVFRANMETQKMEDMTDDEGDSQSEGFSTPKKISLLAMETQMIDDTKQEIDNASTLASTETGAMTDLSMKDNKGVQEEEDNEEQLTGLFSASTLVCEGLETDNEASLKQEHAEEDSQNLSETLPITNTEKPGAPCDGRRIIVAIEDEATVAVGCMENTVPVVIEEATLQLKDLNNLLPVNKKSKTMSLVKDTRLLDGKEDPTLCASRDDATVAFRKEDATLPVVNDDAGSPANREDATLAISKEDATMPAGNDDDVAAVPNVASLPLDRNDVLLPLSDTIPYRDKLAMEPSKTNSLIDMDKDFIPNQSGDATVPVDNFLDDATQPTEDGGYSDSLATVDHISSERGKSPSRMVDTPSGAEKALGLGMEEHSKMADSNDVSLSEDEEELSQPLLLPQIIREEVRDITDDDTPELVPESSIEDEESTSIIRIPAKSPLKPVLVDRSRPAKSPSPKRVAFAECKEQKAENRESETAVMPASTSNQKPGRGRLARSSHDVRVTETDAAVNIDRRRSGRARKPTRFIDESDDEGKGQVSSLSLPATSTPCRRKDKAGRKSKGSGSSGSTTMHDAGGCVKTDSAAAEPAPVGKDHTCSVKTLRGKTAKAAVGASTSCSEPFQEELEDDAGRNPDKSESKDSLVYSPVLSGIFVDLPLAEQACDAEAEVQMPKKNQNKKASAKGTDGPNKDIGDIRIEDLGIGRVRITGRRAAGRNVAKRETTPGSEASEEKGDQIHSMANSVKKSSCQSSKVEVGKNETGIDTDKLKTSKEIENQDRENTGRGRGKKGINKEIKTVEETRQENKPDPTDDVMTDSNNASSDGYATEYVSKNIEAESSLGKGAIDVHAEDKKKEEDIPARGRRKSKIAAHVEEKPAKNTEEISHGAGIVEALDEKANQGETKNENVLSNHGLGKGQGKNSENEKDIGVKKSNKKATKSGVGMPEKSQKTRTKARCDITDLETSVSSTKSIYLGAKRPADDDFADLTSSPVKKGKGDIEEVKREAEESDKAVLRPPLMLVTTRRKMDAIDKQNPVEERAPEAVVEETPKKSLSEYKGRRGKSLIIKASEVQSTDVESLASGARPSRQSRKVVSKTSMVKGKEADETSENERPDCGILGAEADTLRPSKRRDNKGTPDTDMEVSDENLAVESYQDTSTAGKRGRRNLSDESKSQDTPKQRVEIDCNRSEASKRNRSGKKTEKVDSKASDIIISQVSSDKETENSIPASASRRRKRASGKEADAGDYSKASDKIISAESSGEGSETTAPASTTIKGRKAARTLLEAVKTDEEETLDKQGRKSQKATARDSSTESQSNSSSSTGRDLALRGRGQPCAKLSDTVVLVDNEDFKDSGKSLQFTHTMKHTNMGSAEGQCEESGSQKHTRLSKRGRANKNILPDCSTGGGEEKEATVTKRGRYAGKAERSTERNSSGNRHSKASTPLTNPASDLAQPATRGHGRKSAAGVSRDAEDSPSQNSQTLLPAESKSRSNKPAATKISAEPIDSDSKDQNQTGAKGRGRKSISATGEKSLTASGMDSTTKAQFGPHQGTSKHNVEAVSALKTVHQAQTPQKRGRKSTVPEDKVSSTPTPAKRGRLSLATSCVIETPKHSTIGSSSTGSKPKIVFTGVVDEPGQRIVKDLGGDMVQTVQECTHLITDKIRRTVKFLCGVARGVPIVTHRWLEKCRSSGKFVDPSSFLVQDEAMEDQYKFVLSTSLQKAAHSPLLPGYHIHVTKGVKPDPQQMKEILLCAGAEFLSSMPKKGFEKTLVISCEEDKALYQACITKGIDVVSAEFILTGILRQEVDIDSLFASNPQGNTSRTKR